MLLAAMFTVALMQRNNELLPLLSAGVSTRRAVRPALIGAMCMLGLSAANQELVLPHVDAFMVENKGDPTGEKATDVNGCLDSRVAHHRPSGHQEGHDRSRNSAVCSSRAGPGAVHGLQAKEARYIPPSAEDKRSGGWLLTSTMPEELSGNPNEDILEMIAPGEFFLNDRTSTSNRVTRLRNWQMYTPTWKLL